SLPELPLGKVARVKKKKQVIIQPELVLDLVSCATLSRLCPVIISPRSHLFCEGQITVDPPSLLLGGEADFAPKGILIGRQRAGARAPNRNKGSVKFNTRVI
ncbi:hypothetical protein CEXT_234481, partial [Caerostris extrusa]